MSVARIQLVRAWHPLTTRSLGEWMASTLNECIVHCLRLFIMNSSRWFYVQLVVFMWVTCHRRWRRNWSDWSSQVTQASGQWVRPVRAFRGWTLMWIMPTLQVSPPFLMWRSVLLTTKTITFLQGSVARRLLSLIRRRIAVTLLSLPNRRQQLVRIWWKLEHSSVAHCAWIPLYGHSVQLTPVNVNILFVLIWFGSVLRLCISPIVWNIADICVTSVLLYTRCCCSVIGSCSTTSWQF